MRSDLGRLGRVWGWMAAILGAALVLGVLAMPRTAIGSPAPGYPVEVPEPSLFFRHRIETALNQVRDANGGVLPQGRVVLTGSSTIAGWKTSADDLVDWPTVNVGLAGSTMLEHAGATEELIGPLRPGALVVYVGVNDLVVPRRPTAFDPQQGQGARLTKTAAVYFSSLKRSAPGAHIYYIGMIESPRKRPVLNDLRRANAGIRALAQSDGRLTFIDVNSALSGPSGLPDERFFADGLHLNADGYRILTDQVRAALWAGPEG